MLRRLLCLLVALLVTAELSAQTTMTVLVMPVNSLNKLDEPQTIPELVAAWAPGSPLSEFFVGLSSGQIAGFAATVRPWVTRQASDIDYSACVGGSPRDSGLLQSTAKTAATAAGVNVNGFNRHTFMMPGFNCAAIANASGNYLNVFGRISQVTWAHEILHAYGLGHALTQSCDASGCWEGYCGACGTYDPYNLMSGSDRFDYPGMFERMNIGLFAGVPWIDPARIPVVSTSGVYTVLEVEARTGQVGLRISGPLDVNTNSDMLGIEVRRDGVILRRAFRQDTFYRNPILLDMDRVTPGSQPVLPQGSSYVWNNITITTDFYAPGSARVRVSFPGGSAPTPPVGVTNLRAE